MATTKILGDFDYCLFGDERFMNDTEIFLTGLSDATMVDIQGLIEKSDTVLESDE